MVFVSFSKRLSRWRRDCRLLFFFASSSLHFPGRLYLQSIIPLVLLVIAGGNDPGVFRHPPVRIRLLERGLRAPAPLTSMNPPTLRAISASCRPFRAPLFLPGFFFIGRHWSARIVGGSLPSEARCRLVTSLRCRPPLPSQKTPAFGTLLAPSSCPHNTFCCFSLRISLFSEESFLLKSWYILCFTIVHLLMECCSCSNAVCFFLMNQYLFSSTPRLSYCFLWPLFSFRFFAVRTSRPRFLVISIFNLLN